MKTWWLIFGCLVVLCVCICVVLMRAEPTGGHGVTHSKFESMHESGGASRHDGLLIIAWIYGTAQLVLFVATLTLGLRADSGSTKVICLGGGCMILTFTAVIMVYAGHMHSDSSPLLLGFPQSTALMLYGLWPLPIFFVVLYFVKFDSWILRPEALDQLADIKRDAANAKTDSRD
jgi:hypothetical protein